MEIGDLNKLTDWAEKLEKFSEQYCKERERFGKAKFHLGIIVASRINEIKDFKSNWSLETAIMFVIHKPIGDTEEEKAVYEESARGFWKDFVQAENNYKGLEKIVHAIIERMNAIKFVNREIK